MTTLALALVVAATSADPITITKDNTVIDRDAVIVIPKGTFIADTDNNGVIQITKDNIKVSFQDGSVLAGIDASVPGFAGWDQMTGTGIRISGKNVSLTNAKVHGYKIGIHATDCDGLTLDTIDASDNYRAHLGSTRLAEDGGDWLSGHHNNNGEWNARYGGAISIQKAKGITIKNVFVRRGQNGVLLDRVSDSKIFDNDLSFLSGWGLAMWRSSGNTITRNAIDFCVRGHVEGVYNRGQDSAGIKFFEQCSSNVIAENSVTHGGDGFFGFAGLEALGEVAPVEGDAASFDATRKGSNDNLFIDNDFSYAPAHGIEMTFGFGNKYIRNRLVENAICGFWGGYSQDSLIAENIIEGNGGMAYGLERGGVNIEHSANNRVLNNTFRNNKVAVHIWWDPDALPTSTKWGKANYKGVTGNVIANNTIEMTPDHPFKPRGNRQGRVEQLLGLQLRDDTPADQPRKVVNTTYFGNKVEIKGGAGKEFALTEGIEVTKTKPDAALLAYEIPKYEVLGKSKPVGARTELRGRDKIIMDEWGPWDHQSPMLMEESVSSGGAVYRVFGIREPVKIVDADKGQWKVSTDGDSVLLTRALKPGFQSWSADITAEGVAKKVTGSALLVDWNVRVFSWKDKADPRKDLEGWRKLARGSGVVDFKHDQAFKFAFGGGGFGNVLGAHAKELDAKKIGTDNFGSISKAKIDLPAGTYRFTTMSDDGIRVIVGEKPVIENWTWHAPTKDTGEFVQARDGSVELTIEHFEIDGASALEFELEKVK